MSGCTDCGRKGGCSQHKAGLLAAVAAELARLYPTRRWCERDDDAALSAPVATDYTGALAPLLARTLDTVALVSPGEPDDLSDYVYVLCFGRPPSAVQVRAGLIAPSVAWEAAGAADDGVVRETHLRLAFSSLAPLVTVQEAVLTWRRAGDCLVIEEQTRDGVFDPQLLARFRKLVAVLADTPLRHVEFGEIDAPPAGFDPAGFVSEAGEAPITANYLFFPQPASSITTSVLPLASEATSVPVSDGPSTSPL